MIINGLCVDYGSRFCPCILAVTGSCVVCSQVNGKAFCDCKASGGICITQEPLTVSYIVPFLRIQVIAMPFMAVCYPSITLFQAMERSREALICSILRKGVIDIPLLIAMNALWPLFGCMWVQPIVDFTSMLVAFYYLSLLHLRHRS